MRVGVLLLAIGVAWFWAEGAQTAPFDPVRIDDDSSETRISWDVSLAYHPRGSSGVGFDDYGQTYTFVRFISHWQLSISMSWYYKRSEVVELFSFSDDSTIPGMGLPVLVISVVAVRRLILHMVCEFDSGALGRDAPEESGEPCDDFSLFGHQAGLNDTRHPVGVDRF